MWTERVSLRVVFVGVAMLVSAGLAVAVKPTERLADVGPRFSLDESIPRQFGDWRIDESIVPVTVSPDVQARLSKIYDQTLARTYINSGGNRIMLSIAYGGDQAGESTQVHRPEFCYASQGFQIVASTLGDMVTRFGSLQVRRLVAVHGRRHEPITYWITVGDRATLPGVGRKLAQLAYGLTGKVPDGMLIRVSSIDPEPKAAYEVQDAFVGDMLMSVDSDLRVRLVGTIQD